MPHSCAAVRSFNIAAKDLLFEYRLVFTLGFLTFINVCLDFFQNKAIPRLAVYKHLESETCQEIGMRMLQFLLGPIIFLSGICFLVYQALTGCNSNEIFVLYIAGFSLACADLHEFVRRWPLRAPLLGHHVMSFVIGLAFVEFEALPPNEEKIIHWTTVPFLTNIGLMWTVDFFHVVYRTTDSLDLIKKVRKLYLWLAPLRVGNVLLVGLGALQSAFFGVWFAFVCLLFMTLAYTYNSYKAITFVMKFDCERYYNSHQRKWFSGTRPSITGSLTESTRSSYTAAPVGRLSSRSLNIPLTAQDEIQNVLPGLRGDIIQDTLEATTERLDPDDEDRRDIHIGMASEALEQDSSQHCL